MSANDPATAQERERAASAAPRDIVDGEIALTLQKIRERTNEEDIKVERLTLNPDGSLSPDIEERMQQIRPGEGNGIYEEVFGRWDSDWARSQGGAGTKKIAYENHPRVLGGIESAATLHRLNIERAHSNDVHHDPEFRFTDAVVFSGNLAAIIKGTANEWVVPKDNYGLLSQPHTPTTTT